MLFSHSAGKALETIRIAQPLTAWREPYRNRETGLSLETGSGKRIAMQKRAQE
ncbi:MAG: hypothetical protein HY343_04555 [Lentisphaerae bacterium]|nr:hypothetical protein [Lentisphaerota bacterium]